MQAADLRDGDDSARATTARLVAASEHCVAAKDELAWCESPTDEPTQILAQLLAADGTPLGEPLALTATAHHMPFVRANTNTGGFLVAWRDYRNLPHSIDIYGQFLGVQGACPGDLDGDGDTDLSDLAALLSAYGSFEGDPDYNPAADLDEDGDVDLPDLAALLADYGCGALGAGRVRRQQPVR